jgi:hypothetical protein
VKTYLGCSGEPVAAIGDSGPDVDMLRAADIAYAPANASREVRKLIAGGECRLVSRPLQAGLLEAAVELCRAAGHRPDDRAASDDAEPPRGADPRRAALAGALNDGHSTCHLRRPRLNR